MHANSTTVVTSDGTETENASGVAKSSRYSSAMRTATPLVTCSGMTDCSPSSTLLASSTPRFTGPGCITRAWGLANPNNSSSTP